MRPLFRVLFYQLFYVLSPPPPSLLLSIFPSTIFDPEFHVHALACDHDRDLHLGPDHHRDPDLCVHVNDFEILSEILTGFCAHDAGVTVIGCFFRRVAKLIVRAKPNVTVSDAVSNFSHVLFVAHCFLLHVHGVLGPGDRLDKQVYIYNVLEASLARFANLSKQV